LTTENNHTYKISIIIPSLNESENLPLLLSDLSEINSESEVLIVDSMSKDNTSEIALNYGAKFFKVNEMNRGLQLNFGAKKAKSDWLLFIHADSRLKENWSKEIKAVLKKNCDLIYFFSFKIKNNKKIFRILEILVNLRCLIYKKPYGDQGLLISKNQYLDIGGYKNIPIMEDIDFINRIKVKKNLIQLTTCIYTSSRKWEKTNFISQAIKNWNLRRKWIKGVSINSIYQSYYSKKD